MKKRLVYLSASIVLMMVLNVLGCSFKPDESNEQRVTVIYDGNGAEGGSVPVDTKSYLLYDDAIVLDNTGNLTRSGYVFAGWFNKREVGWRDTIYKAGDKYRVYGNDVLYAVWNSTSTITVSIVSVDDISITKAVDGTTIKFTAEEGYDSYIWKIDGIKQTEITNAMTFDTSGLSSGIYTISLVVKNTDWSYNKSKGDEYKSAIIYVKVEAV